MAYVNIGEENEQVEADSLDVSARTIQRLLNDMSEIHFTGGGRSGHWEIDGE